MKIITESGKHTFTLKKSECVPLELKLSVTSKAKGWKHIGDYLFEFGTDKEKAISELVVTNEQYEFLIMLMGKKNWEECKHL
jgi:hypothetical protein